MPHLSLLSDGFLLSLSLCLDIGIVNVAILSATLAHGFKPGFWVGFGSCFGDLAYAALALAGMTALLQFPAVRWVVWIGGSIVLLVLAWRMAREALQPASAPGASGGDTAPRPRAWRGFARGALLALSSPSSILWFAAVGGALIARAGATEAATAAVFLGGFFVGGLAWTVFLCGLASHGRQRAGAGLMRACRALSALLFAYFAYGVICDGYRDLLAPRLGGAETPVAARAPAFVPAGTARALPHTA